MALKLIMKFLCWWKESNLTMAKSTGLGLIELSTILYQEKPDIVVTVGDRFETMATAIAAAYMNIPLAHTMGGKYLELLMRV